ncbi:probable methyltransferase TARBP1 isoform X2 [Zootermopsis nevadensis]|uniref:probable methyltransferase TARBP1 isoform X2 n=1 Tax=Zootermopsis nevadensis TaxID=136037 RepID=UPI000B8E29E8|nr:probable methyltransferase TARBP1 isoform X2 [Zootermopsis nevadensis]
MTSILTGASESSTSELISVLNLLGDDKLEDNVNRIILGLVSSLTVETSPDIKTLNILTSVLKLKNKLRDGTAAEDSLLDCKHIFNLCSLLIDRNSDIKGQCFNCLCDVLQQTLLLMGKDSLYSCVTNVVIKCQKDLTLFVNNADIEESKYACSSRPEVSLRILETVCAAVLHKHDSSALNQYETDSIILRNDDVYNLILTIVCCGVEHIAIQTLQSVIPKVIMCTTDNTLLQKLWRHITTNVDSDLSHTFQILCILIQFYLPSDLQNVHMSYSVTKENMFWKMLQIGLRSADPLVRKRALYLMKRAVVSLCQNNTSVSLNCPDAVFWWDSTDSSEVWEQFFLIIETLEEKQVHIIKPVLPVVDFLCASYNKSNILHVSWILCVFCRIISHYNSSIVKWGIINFVRIHRELHLSRNGYVILEFVRPFMNGVSNSALYSGNTEHSSLSEVGEALKDLFESVITESSYGDCRAFFCHVLDVMNSISWAPVPLFNVMYALAHTRSIPVWNKQSLGILKDFVSEALGCQYIFIRGAVQCMLLNATIHLADHDSLDVYTVADYLGSFRSSESLKRGTSAWQDTVKWIQMFVSKDDAARFVTMTLSAPDDVVCLSMRGVARMVILLCDAALLPCCMIDKTCSLANLLYSILSCFHNCDKRLYASEAEQNRTLQLVVCLLNESHTACGDDLIRKTIISYVNSMMDQIFICISRRMLSAIHLQDYHLVNSYLLALSSFADEVDFVLQAKTHLSKLQDTALQVLVAPAPPMSYYFSMKVLSWISHWLQKHCHCTCDASGPCVILQRQGLVIHHIICERRLNSPPVKQNTELELTRDLQTLWGRMISGYLEAGWSVVADFLHSCHKAEDLVLSLRSVEDIVSDIASALEIGGRSALVPLMNVLGKILPRCLVSETLKLISICWSMVFELRKTELFWTAMEAFIQMLFQPLVMTTAAYQDHLLQYSYKIFSHGEAIVGLCNILITQLQKLAALSSPDILQRYCAVLVDALTFGPVHRRDRRIITDTCRFISSLGKQCSINDLASNDCCVDSEVRARALQLLLVACGSGLSHQFVGKLMDALVLKDRAESSHKTRYYGDSQLHRLKHRVMQSLLVLEPLLDVETAERLVQWLQDSLLMESQQPSVRYQQEWLLTRLLYHHPHLRDRLWDMFQQGRQKRPGSMCSFIAVLYQLACVLIDEEEVFVGRSMREILPCCMAQHFSVRLYAQTTLQKLIALCKAQRLDRVSTEYYIVELSLQASVKHGNAVKNVHKLQEDFYFSAFHPVEHYTLETIFYDLPRLAGVTDEEWISPDLLRSCGVSEMSHIDLVNSNCALKQFAAAAWMPKSSVLLHTKDLQPSSW